jgi:4-oxalocrotonate tautomerase
MVLFLRHLRVIYQERDQKLITTRRWSLRTVNLEGETMPLINVKVIEGVFSDSQKQTIIKELTETMVRIEGENLREYTLVFLEEVKSGSWGVGGNTFTTEAVKQVAAAPRAA